MTHDSLLRFNFRKYDFSIISEGLKHFYPIGINREEDTGYFSYPGIQEIEKIVVENIHERENFESRWVNFTKAIAHQTGKEIVGTSYGQAPSFSSFIKIDTASLDNLTRKKELYFFVSLVGPFYTVIGQDSNSISVGRGAYRSTNYLVVSPEDEYAELFNVLCNAIEQQFKDYRFVPFYIYSQSIEGLSVRYSDEKNCTVLQALFNDQIPLGSNILGDKYYKSETWTREGHVDDEGGWKIYPPIQDK